MPTQSRPLSAPAVPQYIRFMEAVLRLSALALLLAALAVGGYVWGIPVEVAQSWAMDAAPDDPLAQFEAVGRREALWWLLRAVTPIVALASAAALLRPQPLSKPVRRLWAAIGSSTRSEGGPLSSTALRLLLAGWIVLAAVHAAQALWQRIEDWPVYRLRSGQQVLPNISQENRDVIRYVHAATPPDAKILVLSDQKLFFLGYYLRPRRIYHPTHPESEFVIPQPHGGRPTPAYRLEDLPEDYIEKLDPDYLLEYFEGPAYADPSRFGEDPMWLAFQRSRYGSDYRPDYLVVLRNLRERPQP